MVVAVTACGSNTTTGGSTLAQPPTATFKTPTTIGPGEGQLNLIAWEGYVDSSWVKTFTAAKVGGVRNYFVEQSWELTQPSVAYLKNLKV